MGFIQSGSTITVQAKLTNAGRKKLYESIEGVSSAFINKFSLGDSDSNYVAIENGAGALSSGHVPIPGNFKSKPRSLVLYKGSYRPGIPVVLFNNNPGPEIHSLLSIRGNTPNTISWTLKTEWPKGETYNEGYWVALINPTNISDSRFNEIFNIRLLNNSELQLNFTGGLSLVEIAQLVGSNVNGQSDFLIQVTGKKSNRLSNIWITIIS